MKSFVHIFSISVISLIALTSLITLSVTVSKKAARYQDRVIAQTVVAPQVPPSSYNEVLNGLLTVSGR